jgi:hypothetical protein
MATKLHKPVSRELNRVKATKNGRIEIADKTGFITAGARSVIATMLPSDEMRFRIKGTRKTYTMSMFEIFCLTQGREAYNLKQERMRVYTLKKNAGYKHLKKPKNVYLPHVASMLRKLHGAVSGG